MTETPQSAQEPISLVDILDWLAQAQANPQSASAGDFATIERFVASLRDLPLPGHQRAQILELLAHQARQTLSLLRPEIHAAPLPPPARLRQTVRSAQNVLERLAQSHLNSLAKAFDPQLPGNIDQDAHRQALTHAVHHLAWHLRIGYLIASPAQPGIWQQLNACLRSALALDLLRPVATDTMPGIESTYLACQLLAIAQPASFTAHELDRIADFIAAHAESLHLDSLPQNTPGCFWIDLEQDTPAHAQVRRPPPPETAVLFFDAGKIADIAHQNLSAPTPSLPPLLLQRLGELWGHPAKRRFPRRRQSKRIRLCIGLPQLWQLLQTPEASPPLSQWMVTNESPDGYAMMHLEGETQGLQVGDIVALQASETLAGWQICIVRWAVSENPEHIEIGLQALAPQAIPATLALPDGHGGVRRTTALLLPETPPIRDSQAVVVPSGTLPAGQGRMILIIEQGNVGIHELQATGLDEQTGNIEVVSVVPQA